MKTSSVGRIVGQRTVDVSFRMTSAYAAVIGAEQDTYLDDGVAGGPVAPPSFMVVLEWPLLLQQPYIGLMGATEANYFELLLHAFQDTHIHRLVRPGDRLDIAATLAEVRDTRAGALAVSRVDTRCARTGEAVATSWIGSMFRGCPVDGPAVREVAAPALQNGAPGNTPWHTEQVAISRALPFTYTECSGHWNPIHTERAFARAAGYPDIVVHGTSTWAIACQRLIEMHAGGDPRRLSRYGARFSDIVTPGQTLALKHACVQDTERTVNFSMSDARGHDVVTKGIAEFHGAA